MERSAGIGFPKAPLVAIALLIGSTLLAVAAVRYTGIGMVSVPDAPVVAVRAFRFEDRQDGSIAVLDENGRDQVDSVAPGTNGFVRGTLRGLARERKRAGVGPEVPFHLVGHADGRLTLEDPGTGRRVDLGSFGPTNAAAFARLMNRRDIGDASNIGGATNGGNSLDTGGRAGAPPPTAHLTRQ
jgi:putative photosynthetic complex assembly protein